MQRSIRPLSLALLLFPLAGCSSEDEVANETSNPPPFPAPLVAGTPESDALAKSAGRCGQPDFAWIDGDRLGSVATSLRKAPFTKEALRGLAEGAKLDLPISLTYDVETRLITYVTQDRGKEIEATAAVAFPIDVPEEAGPMPTLLVLHGTSGFTDGCGPSQDAETLLLGAALASSGFIVVAPDYIGLKNTEPKTGFLHPYLAGQPTAIASLDAVRALRSLAAEIGEGGARPSPRVAVLGGSQGGHAALWVDRLAPYYARELEIAGIVATVPPSDMVTEGVLALSSVRSSSGNMMAFYGASAGWYGADARLDEVFVPPFDTDVPAALAASCDPGDVIKSVTSLEEVFQPALLEAATQGKLADEGTWGCMLVENGLLETSVSRIQKDAPSYGILFVTGEKDSLVDTPTERVAFEKLCGGGMPLRYLECAEAGHTQGTSWALPEILDFLHARLAGEAFTPSCQAGAPVRCQGTPKE